MGSWLSRHNHRNSRLITIIQCRWRTPESCCRNFHQLFLAQRFWFGLGFFPRIFWALPAEEMVKCLGKKRSSCSSKDELGKNKGYFLPQTLARVLSSKPYFSPTEFLLIRYQLNMHKSWWNTHTKMQIFGILLFEWCMLCCCSRPF